MKPGANFLNYQRIRPGAAPVFYNVGRPVFPEPLAPEPLCFGLLLPSRVSFSLF